MMFPRISLSNDSSISDVPSLHWSHLLMKHVNASRNRRSSVQCSPCQCVEVFLLLSAMESRIEQRANVKMGVRMGLCHAEIQRNLRRVWGDHALSRTQVAMWFKRFQADPDASCKDKLHSECLRSVRVQRNVDLIQNTLNMDKRSSIKELSSATGISTMSVHRILRKDLQVRKVAAKFIPKLLNNIQKRQREENSASNLRKIQADATILDRIVTCDKSCVFSFDLHTKQANMQWLGHEEPRPSKALRSRSQKKVMLVLFFDHAGVIHIEFLNRNRRINSEVYIEILRRMRESLCRKHPVLWANHNWFLHQDNAPCHVFVEVADYLFTVDMAEYLWPHPPPYSPDLAPCDFWAFPLLKKQIHGRCFADLEEVKDTVRTIFRRTPPAEYHNVFTNLGRRYQKCIQSRGEYFEGH